MQYFWIESPEILMKCHIVTSVLPVVKAILPISDGEKLKILK
jgi:hypothetical protein